MKQMFESMFLNRVQRNIHNNNKKRLNAIKESLADFNIDMTGIYRRGMCTLPAAMEIEHLADNLKTFVENIHKQQGEMDEKHVQQLIDDEIDRAAEIIWKYYEQRSISWQFHALSITREFWEVLGRVKQIHYYGEVLYLGYQDLRSGRALKMTDLRYNGWYYML